MKNLLLIGAGGHEKSFNDLINVFDSLNKACIVGIKSEKRKKYCVLVEWLKIMN
tara:strand:+ start:839 stop:1000 length:162 start_codon:yes stop_codon:yes gene_type:complete